MKPRCPQCCFRELRRLPIENDIVRTATGGFPATVSLSRYSCSACRAIVRAAEYSCDEIPGDAWVMSEELSGGGLTFVGGEASPHRYQNEVLWLVHPWTSVPDLTERLANLLVSLPLDAERTSLVALPEMVTAAERHRAWRSVWVLNDVPRDLPHPCVRAELAVLQRFVGHQPPRVWHASPTFLFDDSTRVGDVAEGCDVELWQLHRRLSTEIQVEHAASS